MAESIPLANLKHFYRLRLDRHILIPGPFVQFVICQCRCESYCLSNMTFEPSRIEIDFEINLTCSNILLNSTRYSSFIIAMPAVGSPNFVMRALFSWDVTQVTRRS